MSIYFNYLTDIFWLCHFRGLLDSNPSLKMTVGEFFLDDGRGSEECERTTIGDERSVASGQPTIDRSDNDDDITATVHLPETMEKSTEIEYLNKDGDVLSAKNCQEKERKKLIYKITKTVTMVIAPAVMVTSGVV